MPIRMESIFTHGHQVDIRIIDDPTPYNDHERLHMLYTAAQAILNDGCPMDTKMHLCAMGEEAEDSECIRCWENYLRYIYNRGKADPYRCDRSIDE